MAWGNLSDRMLRTALNVFGDPVTYTRGATTVQISKAVFDANFLAVDPDTGATVQSTGPMIGVRLAELPGGKAEKGDKVVRNGVTYRVIESQPDSEGHARLILHTQ